MTADSRESVLRRWSRRKLETHEAHEALADETPKPDAADLAAAEAEAKPVLTDADMPPLESLTEESDFSPFMSEGVSEELRNLALRKLFRSSVFNIRDGLDEYDEDYTFFEKLGDIVTADMKHQIEMQQQKLREQLAAEGREGEVAAVAGEAGEAEAGDDDFAEDSDGDSDEAGAAPAQIAATGAARDAPATPPNEAGGRDRAEKKS